MCSLSVRIADDRSAAIARAILSEQATKPRHVRTTLRQVAVFTTFSGLEFIANVFQTLARPIAQSFPLAETQSKLTMLCSYCFGGTVTAFCGCSWGGCACGCAGGASDGFAILDFERTSNACATLLSDNRAQFSDSPTSEVTRMVVNLLTFNR